MIYKVPYSKGFDDPLSDSNSIAKMIFNKLRIALL